MSDFNMEGGDGKTCITRLSMEIHQVKNVRPTKDYIISFSQEDLTHIGIPHKDAFVVTIEIDGFKLRRIFTTPLKVCVARIKSSRRLTSLWITSSETQFAC